MPLKIHYPKKNNKHKQRMLIVQGKCNDAAKTTGVLLNKTTGQIIPGRKLSKNMKQWGYMYQGLTKGDYKFTVTEANNVAVAGEAQQAASADASDLVDFTVEPGPIPPVGNPPTIFTPADNDEVGAIFYPTGTSNAAQLITDIEFTGNGTTVAGTVTQQPDANGDWAGEVDVSACPSGGGYVLTVTNNTGPTSVNNLSIP